MKDWARWLLWIEIVIFSGVAAVITYCIFTVDASYNDKMFYIVYDSLVVSVGAFLSFQITPLGEDLFDNIHYWRLVKAHEKKEVKKFKLELKKRRDDYCYCKINDELVTEEHYKACRECEECLDCWEDEEIQTQNSDVGTEYITSEG